jgi:hypothetical protein
MKFLRIKFIEFEWHIFQQIIARHPYGNKLYPSPLHFLHCINAEKVWVKDGDARIAAYRCLFIIKYELYSKNRFSGYCLRHIFSWQIPQFSPKDNDVILSIVKVLIAKHLDASLHCINAEKVWVKDGDARIAAYRCLLAIRYVVDSRL